MRTVLSNEPLVIQRPSLLTRFAVVAGLESLALDPRGSSSDVPSSFEIPCSIFDIPHLVTPKDNAVILHLTYERRIFREAVNPGRQRWIGYFA